MLSQKIDILDLLILKLMVLYEEDIFVVFSIEDLSYMEKNIKDGFILSKKDLSLLSSRDFMDFIWVDNSLEGFISFLSKEYSSDWSIDAMKHVSFLLASRTINLEKIFQSLENCEIDLSFSLESIILKDFPITVLL